MKNFITIIFLALAACLSAQEAIRLTGDKNGTDTQVSVQNFQVAYTDVRTILTMDFILDQLDVPSNRYRAFTPIVRSKDGTQEQRLKTLIVSGRRQEIVFERDGIDALYAAAPSAAPAGSPSAATASGGFAAGTMSAPVVLRRYNGTAQTYAYTDAIDRQPWHKNAEVLIEADLCGCGDKMKNEEFPIATLEQPDPWDLISLANQEPDAYKPMRELHGSAYITFVVDRWEMKPDYMDNRRELRKITDTLDIMVADKNITVNTIKIHGWASPESPYYHNHMLATNRAKSLTEWLRRNYQLPATAFAPAEATPENWIGLREALTAGVSDASSVGSPIPHQAEIAAIVSDLLQQDSITIARTADATEGRIKRLYPQDYQYLLREVYPSLRRSDYEITFNIRQFNTIEECLDIYRTKPYQLSKHELWRVAQTMQPFSDDYNRCMQTALNYYPDDEVVNLNLAVVALMQRDLLKAQTLLEHAGNGAAAENARAVIDIVSGNYAAAAQHLDAAERQDLDASLRSLLSPCIEKNREAIRLLTP